jgi:hypothetical protein
MRTVAGIAQPAVATPLNVLELAAVDHAPLDGILERGEGPFLACGDDLLDGDGADSRERLELLGRGRVQIDESRCATPAGTRSGRGRLRRRLPGRHVADRGHPHLLSVTEWLCEVDRRRGLEVRFGGVATCRRDGVRDPRSGGQLTDPGLGDGPLDVDEDRPAGGPRRTARVGRDGRWRADQHADSLVGRRDGARRIGRC